MLRHMIWKVISYSHGIKSVQRFHRNFYFIDSNFSVLRSDQMISSLENDISKKQVSCFRGNFIFCQNMFMLVFLKYRVMSRQCKENKVKLSLALFLELTVLGDITCFRSVIVFFSKTIAD